MNSIDNVLDVSQFTGIQDKILGPTMDWYYREVTTYRNEPNNRLYDGSFSHWALTAEGYKSHLYQMLHDALVVCLAKTGQELDKMLRIRIGMYMLTPEEFIHTAHIDCDIPHQSGLLYLQSSESPTIFYNEFYEPETKMDSYDRLQQLQLSEFGRIYPKENSFAWFDGLRYHCSSSPTKEKRRVVVNYNYTVKE